MTFGLRLQALKAEKMKATTSTESSGHVFCLVALTFGNGQPILILNCSAGHDPAKPPAVMQTMADTVDTQPIGSFEMIQAAENAKASPPKRSPSPSMTASARRTQYQSLCGKGDDQSKTCELPPPQQPPVETTAAEKPAAEKPAAAVLVPKPKDTSVERFFFCFLIG